MEENKNVNKYHNQSIYVWVIVLIVSYFMGQAIFSDAGNAFGKEPYGYAILAIICGYILGTILYELGKLIFGKIAGYNLIYINLFGFTFIKNKDNKTSLKFTKFENYGGKTLMSPKSNKSCLSLYLLGGSIFSSIITALMIVGSHLLVKEIGLRMLIYIEYIMATVMLIILIFNLAPFLNDDLFDGFILRLVHHYKFKEQYHKILLEENALITGRGELLFFEDVDYSNPLISRASIYNYYYLLNKDEEKAKEMIQIGLDNDNYLTDEDIGILLSNKYYFKLMNDNYEKVGEEFYKEEKSYRKIAVNYNNYGSIKTALLVSSLVDSSYDLYEHILNVMDKKKTNFSSLRIEKENQLIERALEFIKLKKEDWFKEDDSAE